MLPIATVPVLAGVLDPEGPAARQIEDLWWLLLVLGTVTFVIVVVVLVAAFRRPEFTEDEVPDVRRWLVLGGVVLPAVGILAVLVATLGSMRAIADEAPEGALAIEIIGHQWWWEVRYPDHDVVTANEVHIPAGEPVELRLTSGDVIHSFWVPALAGKMDLLPDGVNTLVIEADEAGRYQGRCAEFCGLQHARMELVVVAASATDFRSWLDEQAEPAARPASAAARRGAELFSATGCAECHTIRGTGADGEVGPDLTHLASRSRIGAGTLPLTTDDLERWVADPHEFKSGTAMPAADLSDEELDALVQYLELLR